MPNGESIYRVIRFTLLPKSLLAKISLGLWLLTSTVGIVTISYGRSVPEQKAPVGVGLMLCEGIPCFRGIIPRQTGWETTLTAFGGKKLNIPDPYYYGISLFPSPDGATVDTISLNRPLDPTVNVGMVIDLFGPPTCIDTFVYQHKGTIILHYPGLHVMSQFTDNRFNSHSPIITIVFGDPQMSGTQPAALCSYLNSTENNVQFSQHPWRGFAFVNHYHKQDAPR